MIFAPKRVGNLVLDPKALEEDKKHCQKIGPCGLGKQAIYLNSFFIDRRYYVMWQDIRRVFKRVAMSRGGFTGKGVFVSIPYLVVLLKDGRERQCNFKYEEDVDSFLSIVRTQHPEIPTMSEKAQARMEEERAREEARYVKDLTPQAELDKMHAPSETFFVRRDRGAGRPTKRDRRIMDEMMDNLNYSEDADFGEDF